jgi:hypothetical protein
MAGKFGHSNVEQHRVRVEVQHRAENLRPSIDRPHVVSFVAQKQHERADGVALIISDDDAQRSRRARRPALRRRQRKSGCHARPFYAFTSPPALACSANRYIQVHIEQQITTPRTTFELLTD